jgi:hypothetical protein
MEQEVAHARIMHLGALAASAQVASTRRVFFKFNLNIKGTVWLV